jgi:diguanylate cyclase (GGDEF)-like protein/PAS domain S-box-containing protein
VRPVETRWAAMVNRLEEQRERFAAIFNDSPDAMAIYHPDGTIMRGNAAAARMLGLQEDSVGKHWSIHVADEQRPAAQVAFDLALAGSSAQFETMFVTSSGAEIPVLCSISPISVMGKIVAVVGIAKDLTDLRASEVELERSRQRFASMFAYHPDAIAVIDENGRIDRANGELARLTGFRADELVGMQLDTLAPAQDVIERRGLAGNVFSPEPAHFDAGLRTKDGSHVVIRVVTVPMRVGDRLDGVYVIARDVTHERELEYRDRQQRERLRTLSRLASLHAGSVDRQISEILQFAARSLELDGSTVARVGGDQVTVLHSVGEGLPVGMVWPFAESFARHIFGTNKVLSFTGGDVEEWAMDPAQRRQGWGSLISTTAFADGVPVAVVAFMSKRQRGRPFEGTDLDFVRIVAAMIGASLAREKREEELERIAYIDPVTRLPNRRYAVDQLRVAVARAERSGERVVVYFIDLDGFKSVNDALGHAAGDEFLAITSARLRGVLREGDVLARVGGDEFMAMQITSEDDYDVLRLAQRLIGAASENVIFEGTSVSAGASIGIAVFPSHASTAEHLLDRADQAMYASKRAGKGQARLYDGIA